MTLEDVSVVVSSWLKSQLLNHNNLHLNNVDKVIEILSQIKLGGIDQLAIVSDFDQTLTRDCLSSGKKCRGGHNLLSMTRVVGSQFTKRLQDLESEYKPYETSTDMSQSEKSKYLVEWFDKIHQTLIEEKLNQVNLKEMARQLPNIYRDGFIEFFNTTERFDIPMVLFSAGVKEIMEAILNQDQLYKSNLFIAANEMIFSKEPPHNVESFRKPYVHMFNKKHYDISKTPIQPSLSNRSSLLLMGDSLGDIDMQHPIPHQHLLKVGFLNEDIEAKLPEYLQAFDLVLTGDTNLNFPIQLLTLLHEK